MVAYLRVPSARPAAAGALVFGAGVGGGVAFGPPKLVDKANDAFCAVVAASFVTLLVVGAGAFDAGRLMSVAPDAKAAFEAVPISILSLVYHNVIPTVSRRLGFDRARIARAVLLGSAFPLVMFIAWNALVQGVVDAGSSADPVAALIAAESGEAGAELSVAVQIFSFSAVVTSFVGFTTACGATSETSWSRVPSAHWPTTSEYSPRRCSCRRRYSPRRTRDCSCRS